MESALSPREIQTRIRSGESVDDVAHVADMDRDRVERFAAPVIAEREHVAGLAMTSSARRRGETSSHRTLRGVLNERLLNRGVDIDTVRWDSFRLDDGRWAVTADYQSGDDSRQAVFYFDVQGRYSVAGNDEGRWVLGDSAGGSEDDTEPTVDLSDELALVRAIQDIPVDRQSEAATLEVPELEITELKITEVEVAIAEVVQLNRPSDDEADTDTDADTEAAEPTIEVRREPEDGLVEDGLVEDSAPSDASAVPELSLPLQPDAWEPAIVVDYPIEPSEDSEELDGYEVPEGSDDPGRPEAAVAREDRRDEAAALPPAPETREPEPEPADQLPIETPEQPTSPPAAKPARRRRASVPSWDEIVFGGPKDE